MSVSDWARRHGGNDEPIEGEVEQPDEQRRLPPPIRPRSEFFRRPPQDVTPPESQPVSLWWKNQQALHFAEMHRRGIATRDRAIGLLIWFVLWRVLPDPWGYFAFWIGVAMGTAMLWNAEQWLVARRQANVNLSDVED